MPADPKNRIEPSTDAVTRFRLIDPPAGFVDDPYPWYAQLRRDSPVHRLSERSYFLSRYDDVMAAYRDPRTNGMEEELAKLMPLKDIYETTGIQFMFFNTLLQLMAEVTSGRQEFKAAEHLLFTPDLINYWL